jgi:hypothetical protein
LLIFAEFLAGVNMHNFCAGSALPVPTAVGHALVLISAVYDFATPFAAHAAAAAAAALFGSLSYMLCVDLH